MPLTLAEYARAAPKAELHLHLEGAMRPATVLALARQNKATLPPDVESALHTAFRFDDFEHFIRTYVAVTRVLRRAEDYERIVVELAEDLARQHVSYAEVTVSPSTHVLFLGTPQQDFVDGLARGRQRALVEHNVELAWIFDVVARSVDPPRYYDFTTQCAIDHRDRGSVAIGLVGMGIDRETEAFLPYVARARASGLHFTPHAGELRGPEQIWPALELLGAERIGHGVRAVEDPGLVETLAAHRIPLEVCPTSNVRLGVYPSHAAHPLRRLHEAGVPVTVNSDDPGLFGATLGDEAALLATALGFTVEQIDEILLNGVRCAFLPPERKTALLERHKGELARLKRELAPASEA
ncbi:MAG TPA: adenosine deaminase [Chloroflexota bacterium]|nr:adenosine deaminase [Chloroflexota bacterium]